MTARRLAFLALLILAPAAAPAQESPPAEAADSGRQRWEGPRLGTRRIGSVDLLGTYNPLGVQVMGSVVQRWVYDVDTEKKIEWAYLQGGFGAMVSPAYAQFQVHVEWMPAAVFTLRLDGTIFGYFGTLGALHQFDQRPDKWDVDRDLDNCPGRDRGGVAYRVMLQPTLQAQVWKIVFRNPLTVAGYGFSGPGKYFYEYENDTLMAATELLVYNQTWLLFEAWKGKKDAVVLVGALYDVTYAAMTKVRRQRVGALIMAQPRDPLGPFDRLRVYGMGGYIIEDEGRQGEPFVAIGIGSDFDF